MNYHMSLPDLSNLLRRNTIISITNKIKHITQSAITQFQIDDLNENTAMRGNNKLKSSY